MGSPSIRIFDGHYKTTGKKTVSVGFRLFKEQADRLKLAYDGNTSAVVRMLLEKLFNGELPEVETKLNQQIQEAQENQMKLNLVE